MSNYLFYHRVDENMLVKVADFGLSRDVYSRDYYRLERRVKLPVKWLPPESLHDNIFTEKTDVVRLFITFICYLISMVSILGNLSNV